MDLSVIIPCYNEADTIREVVLRVREVVGGDDETIVVDDGSTDGSGSVLAQHVEGSLARVLYHERNAGCLKTDVKRCSL